jgi:hypothetical protein
MTTTSIRPASGHTVRPYPVRLDAELDQPLSRWLWLFKWLLALPHYVVLVVLWMIFAVLSVLAFFAILVTGRYPRAIFDFNLGVLRWSWRVAYYAYGTLGTDRYPPFSLGAEPDYPARLEIEYPAHLSRGLVLVKWWLLAIPHYLLVCLFVGGGAWFGWRADHNWSWGWGGGGLVGILTMVAGVILLITGQYPGAVFDVVLGLQRWVFRVAGYACLMTDEYPPFRLDLGGADPGRPAPAAGPTTHLTDDRPPVPLADPGPDHQQSRSAWTPGRVATLVCGALSVFLAVGLLVAGVALTVADRVSRDSQGYLTSPSVSLSTDGYAITSEAIRFEANGPAWALPARTVGTTRIHVQPANSSTPLFVGIARTAQVRRYLTGVRYQTVSGYNGGSEVDSVLHQGSAPSTAPTQLDIWAARISGPGAQILTWTPSTGNWSVVVMNADASAPVSIDAQLAATVPALTWIATGLAVVGAVLLVLGVVLIVVVARAVTRA